jgi:hypothetical protein
MNNKPTLILLSKKEIRYIYTLILNNMYEMNNNEIVNNDVIISLKLKIENNCE